MEQVSEIIKLWIHKESKLLCAKKAQSEQLDKHLPSFPILNLITLDIPDRFIEKYYYPFRIALYYTKNIDERSVERHFFQSRLVGGVENKGCEFSPIIHILQDENNNERTIFFEQTYLKKHPYIPRFRAIVDSSIWNYFLTEDSDFDSIINKIYENYQKCYYNLRVAEEYTDLNARLTANAELYVNPLDKEANGHAKNVSAFLFHSERKLRKKLEEPEVQESINSIKKYKWRFLLVDDHANVKMSSAEKDLPTPTKLDIIKEKFEKLFVTTEEKDSKDAKFIIATENDNKDIKEKANIYIEYATSINDAKDKIRAKDKLKEKKYEIILLDYLLGEMDGRREYSYELLKDIHEIECEIQKKPTKEKEIKFERKFDYKKGPDNRFYFMFISAFTTAVSERLLLEGWHRSEPYWYIGEGACPVNTPYLFQYRLLHIMQKRMKDMGLAKWNVREQEKEVDSADNKTDQPSNAKDIYNELINEIYTGEGVRKRANDKFQDILDLLYHYKNLLLDTDMPSDNVFDSAESVLATNFVMNHMGYEGVLEHLTQLVYLTAFGTVRQWPEMWEEYQYIKSYLGRIQCVEDFIVNLKNNSIK